MTVPISPSHKRILRGLRIPLRCYLGSSASGLEVYTSECTLVCREGHWCREPVDRGSTTGRNETGHRLPVSSTGEY